MNRKEVEDKYYRQMLESEKHIAAEQHEVPEDLASQVMKKVSFSNQGFSWRLFNMEISRPRRMQALYGALATCAVILVALQITERPAIGPVGFHEQLKKAESATGKAISGPLSVYVAVREIQAGEKITADLFSAEVREGSTIPDRVVLNLSTVIGQFAKGPIGLGQPLMFRDLTPTSTSALPEQIKRDEPLPVRPGYRAVTIPVEAVSGVEGHAKPGSSADIVLSFSDKGQKTAKIVTHNARIISSSGGTVTLEVTPHDALTLNTAKSMGDLSTLLRPEEESQSATRDITSYDSSRSTGEKHTQKLESSELTNESAVILQKMLEGDEKIASAKPNGQASGYAARAPGVPAMPDTRGYYPPTTWNPPVNTVNTERYAEYEENKRILATEEAISTFSVDVDTGSYTNARRFLRLGQLPPTDSVRIEEFLNYFKYDYPVQYEKPFTLTYEIAPSPLEPERHLLRLGIKTRDARNLSEQGWNLVFLVDVSGSMNEADKLPLVKESLKLLVNQMRPQDRIAIVTYAGWAGLVLDSTGIERKSEIIHSIDTLQPGGGTNGAGGINLAYDIARKSLISGGVNRVILATDGDFNVGVSSVDELKRMIEEKRKGGVTLTTLGFGTGNYKDDVMEQLANRGNGNYFYIDSFKEARKVLESDLFATMEVVAKDVKLQIEFNPKHVLEYRLIGYENRKLRKEDFNNDRIDAGEIGSGHTVTALYEIVLVNSPAAASVQGEYRYQHSKEQSKREPSEEFTNELAFLKIRHKEPNSDSSSLLTYPIASSDVKTEASEGSVDLRFAAAVSYFGHILRKSQFAGNYTLSSVAQLAQGALGDDQTGYRKEFVELVRNASALLGHSVTRNWGE